MTDLVNPDRIERVVGWPRDPRAHIGRAVSEEQTFYILHSQECKDSGIDLRECRFSAALDQGIRPEDFDQDEPVLLGLKGGHLTQTSPRRSAERTLRP